MHRCYSPLFPFRRADSLVSCSPEEFAKKLRFVRSVQNSQSYSRVGCKNMLPKTELAAFAPLFWCLIMRITRTERIFSLSISRITFGAHPPSKPADRILRRALSVAGSTHRSLGLADRRFLRGRSSYSQGTPRGKESASKSRRTELATRALGKVAHHA